MPYETDDYHYWLRWKNITGGDRLKVIRNVAAALLNTSACPVLVLALTRAYNVTYCRPPLPQGQVDGVFSDRVQKEMARLRRLAQRRFGLQVIDGGNA